VRPQRAIQGMLALLVLSSIACALSESAVATRMAQTEEAQALEALVQTATAAAQATDSPISAATATAPPGMGYVPDFLGMDLADAEHLLEQLDFRYIWVAMINREVTEWQVCEQSPDPGSLIDPDADRVRIVVAVYEFTPTSSSGGGGNCGSITSTGACIGDMAVWCEGGTLQQVDCSTIGCLPGDCTMSPSPDFPPHVGCFCI